MILVTAAPCGSFSPHFDRACACCRASSAGREGVVVVASRSRAQAEAAAARPTKRAGSVRRQRDGLLSALARDTERTARRVAERARSAGASRFGLRQRLCRRGARRQRERDHKGSQCFHCAIRRDQRGGIASNFGIEAISLTQACCERTNPWRRGTISLRWRSAPTRTA